MLAPVMAAATDRLVGRAAELEVLDRAFAALEGGYGGALTAVAARTPALKRTARAELPVQNRH